MVLMRWRRTLTDCHRRLVAGGIEWMNGVCACVRAYVIAGYARTYATNYNRAVPIGSNGSIFALLCIEYVADAIFQLYLF